MATRSITRRPLINILLIIRVVGLLLFIEAGFMLLPLIVSLLKDDGEAYVFLFTIGVTVAFAFIFSTLFPKPRHDMSKRDGFLLTALIWIVFSFFAMIPFMCEPLGVPFSSAYFETMSGFTTTGISLLGSLEPLPPSIVLWRSQLQWIGGMGIIIFTLAVLPMFNNSGGVQMFNAEVTGITPDKLRPRVSSTAKGLWGMYIGLTLLCVGLLWVGPMDLIESLSVAFSVLSTGGYATASLNIFAWDSTYVELVVIIFMFLGATNFTLIYSFIHGRFGAPWRNDVFRFFIWTILVMTVIVAVSNVITGNIDSIKDYTLYPLFNVISLISSTGFVVGDLIGWGPFVLCIMLMLMFFGACAGSTSGGAKLDRLLYLLKNTNNELYRALHPNSVVGLTMNGRNIQPEIVNKVIAFLSLYIMVVALGCLTLTLTGLPLYESFFASLSCMSNDWVVELATVYGGSFELIPDFAKWVMSFLMLVGRLEVFTVILLFTPYFWDR